MNGLNKQYNKYKRLLIISSVVFILLGIGIAMFLLNVPNIYNSKMDNKVDLIKKEVNKKIQSSNVEKRFIDFKEYTNENDIQLIVKQDNLVLYSNVPLIDFNDLLKSNQKNNIYYSSEYQLEKDGDKITVGLIVYNVSQSELLHNYIYVIVVCIIISLVVISFIMYTFIQSIIKPLSGLENNINKLKEYNFNDLTTSEEKISLFANELEEFANSIKIKADNFEIAYTSLEKELLAKEEQSQNKKEIVSTLVHDLKTPLGIIKLHTNELLKEIRQNNQVDRLYDIKGGTEDILLDVNSILKVANEEQEIAQINQFDLSTELKKAISSIIPLLQDKGIAVVMDIVPNAIISARQIEVQSIINNALSNIYNYADLNTEAKVYLDADTNNYILKFENISQNSEKLDVDNIFNIFNGNEKNKNSSGVGLFLLKRFVENNNGVCMFTQDEEKVVLEIRLPKNGGIDNE